MKYQNSKLYEIQIKNKELQKEILAIDDVQMAEDMYLKIKLFISSHEFLEAEYKRRVKNFIANINNAKYIDALYNVFQNANLYIKNTLKQDNISIELKLDSDSELGKFLIIKHIKYPDAQDHFKFINIKEPPWLWICLFIAYAIHSVCFSKYTKFKVCEEVYRLFLEDILETGIDVDFYLSSINTNDTEVIEFFNYMKILSMYFVLKKMYKFVDYILSNKAESNYYNTLADNVKDDNKNNFSLLNFNYNKKINNNFFNININDKIYKNLTAIEEQEHLIDDSSTPPKDVAEDFYIKINNYIKKKKFKQEEMKLMFLRVTLTENKYKKIAKIMNCSESSIKQIATSIMNKLGGNTLDEAIRIFQQESSTKIEDIDLNKISYS